MLNGLNKGAVDFLVKPVDPLTVQERICGCVRRAWQPGSTILDGPEPAADTEQPAAPVDTLTEAEYWDRLLELFFQARPNLSPAKYHALGRISAALAEGLCKAVPTCGLTLEEAQLIGRAAAYCDVGLLGIPDNIIEMGQDQGGSGQEVYFRHTALGHALFTTGPSSSRPLARYAAEIAYWHHKNFDGTGYPTEESAAPIPLSAQIVRTAIRCMGYMDYFRGYPDCLDRTVRSLATDVGRFISPDLYQAARIALDNFPPDQCSF